MTDWGLSEEQYRSLMTKNDRMFEQTAKKLSLNNLSDLEYVVGADMIEHGYDPYNKEDIKEFWEERLDG